MAIELQWTMHNSDINAVGETLGFDWNDICDEIANEELNGSDGSGYNKIASKPLVAIFEKIFKEHPDMQKITILDNF